MKITKSAESAGTVPKSAGTVPGVRLIPLESSFIKRIDTQNRAVFGVQNRAFRVAGVIFDCFA